jgi:hypothetical protein
MSVKEWYISVIGTLAYEYTDGVSTGVYSEASFRALLKDMKDQEGVSEKREWLEEGLATLKETQRILDSAHGVT